MPTARIRQALNQFFDLCIKAGYPPVKLGGIISAVSGGPDSMALGIAVHEYASCNNIIHKVMIIDHGLRIGSDVEAQLSAEQLRQKGIDVIIQTVEGVAPHTGLQNYARLHRFSLLSDEARRQSALVLFAHHRGDQAETIAMRLSRGASFHALSGIASLRYYQGVLFGRPFLNLSKADLMKACSVAGLQVVSDPSNENPVFERVRIRRFLADKKNLSESLLRLSAVASKFVYYYNWYVNRWINSHCQQIYTLQLRCPRIDFDSLSEEHRSSVLRAMISRISTMPILPSMRSVNKLSGYIKNRQNKTLGGCIIKNHDQDFTISAEFGRNAPRAIEIQPYEVSLFDRRWHVISACVGRINRLGMKRWSNRPSHWQPFARQKTAHPAHIGAMIPLLTTLDGRQIYPHLINQEDVCADLSVIESLVTEYVFVAWPIITDGVIHGLCSDHLKR